MQSQVSIEKHLVVEDRDLDELLEQAIARAIHSNGATPRRPGVGEVMRCLVMKMTRHLPTL